MKNLVTILSALSLLSLTACQTIQSPPVVVTKTCTPPDVLVSKHADLPAIQGNTLTEKQILSQWIDDTQAYNNLNIDHNGLIDWINTYCKK
jgi:hypothetical protein